MQTRFASFSFSSVFLLGEMPKAAGTVIRRDPFSVHFLIFTYRMLPRVYLVSTSPQMMLRRIKMTDDCNCWTYDALTRLIQTCGNSWQAHCLPAPLLTCTYAFAQCLKSMKPRRARINAVILCLLALDFVKLVDQLERSSGDLELCFWESNVTIPRCCSFWSLHSQIGVSKWP